MMYDFVDQAAWFAAGAHAGQVRKYTGEPYIYHPGRVAQLVPHHLKAAAFLHDVIEDTPVTEAYLTYFFPPTIVRLVVELTDVSKPEDGNRATRKEIDRQHLANASPDAKTIKLADLIDNSTNIFLHDPDFAKVYLKEKRSLLEVLKQGDEKLYRQAASIVETYLDQVNGPRPCTRDDIIVIPAESPGLVR